MAMKKVFLLLTFAGAMAFTACNQKPVEEAETTPEETPAEDMGKTNMPNTTVTDSTGKPVSQDTSSTTAAGDKAILGDN